MKSIFITLSLASFTAVPALDRVTGKIDAVTVFTDRAIVTRVQTVPPDQKTGTLLFTDLPQSLVSGSVRASGTGLTVTGVSLRQVRKVAGDEWASNPLKKKMVRLDAQIREENDKLANYRNQLHLLDSMMKLTTAQSDREARAGAMNVDSWEKALSFLEGKRSAYQDKIRSAEEQIKEMRKEHARTSLLFNAEIQVSKTAAVEAEISYVRNAATAHVELEYLVTNVSWNSIYDLRGSAEGSEFKLVSHAIIRQNSGENWKNASVTLSTARPSVSMAPGILTPWRVSGNSTYGSGAKHSASGKLSAGMNSRDEGEASVTDTTEVTDSSETTTVSIKLPGRENILSDNSDHKVTLNTAVLRGTLSHVAVPSLSSYVYLKARLKNTSAAPVIGTMNAFLDGSFVGAANLKNAAAVGEEFDVFLGPDQRMQLKRTLKRGDVENGGLFSSKIEVVNQWEIEVANFTRKTRTITVYDQYPIPADPNISTKYIGATRAETQKDANGILTWKLDVKSGEKIKYDFSYSLLFPKDIWESFSRTYETNNAVNEEQYYDQLSNKPAAARPRKQYNLERMLQKH
jgi:uncharacterized protein (TIGR02231 family)